MTYVFNGGTGGLICDNCRTLIAVGKRDNLKFIYSTKPEDVYVDAYCKGMGHRTEREEYCSKKCYEARNQKVEE